MQVYESCIKWLTEMFSLVNEGVGDEDVISPPTPFSECSLEGVGNISILHELHKAGVEGARKELP